MTRRRRWILQTVLALAGVALGCTRPALGGPVEAATGRQPRVEIAPDGTGLLVYGRGDAVYFRSLGRDGRTVGDEVRVGSLPGLHLGMRRGPRVAATDEAVIVTAIARCVDGKRGDVVAWRSTDEGRTWSEPQTLNRVPTAAREGLHGLAASPDGRVMCVWLDLRNDRTEICGTSSTDGGATWAKDRRIYASPGGTVCECCHPSVAWDGKGRVWVMFRNALGGARDMYVTSSADCRRFSRARKLGDGTWPLEACPMDGGAVVGVPDGGAVTVWRRDGTIFTAVPGEPEARVDDGFDSAAALGRDGVHLVWLEKRADAALRYRAPSGDVRRLADRAVAPTIAASPSGAVVVAWEAGDKIVVDTIETAARPADGDEDGDDAEPGGPDRGR